MYRQAINELQKWKTLPIKKPLLICGARQVGKTWLMKEFGKTAYTNTVYINCDANPTVKTIFDAEPNPQNLFKNLEIYSGKKILPKETLLILDEIQEIPRAIAALKYFNEEAPEYDIICAGSLLGVALHAHTSFPVGKVNFLNLYPLTFNEFLRAIGQNQYAELLEQGDTTSLAPFHEKYTEFLKLYYFIGGMPEVILTYAQTGSLDEVKRVQNEIITSYRQDFSKHAPQKTVPLIHQIWDSIPSQLAKENKKFIYGLIREGARSKEYEEALLWLRDCGLIYKVTKISAPRLPLSAYEDLRAFKIYLTDTGLLCRLSGLDAQDILSQNKLFVEFRGALTEQYVLCALTSQGLNPHYWANDKGSAEVDYVIQFDGEIYPIEVKAAENLQAKSLKLFAEKYSSHVVIRVSLSGFRTENEGKFINIPLYAVSNIKEIIKSASDK